MGKGERNKKQRKTFRKQRRTFVDQFIQESKERPLGERWRIAAIIVFNKHWKAKAISWNIIKMAILLSWGYLLYNYLK